MRSEEDDLTAISEGDANQFVTLLNSDGNDAARHYIREVFQFGLLHRPVSRGEEDVTSRLFQVTDGQHGANRLSRLQRNQVADVFALAGGADIGNLVHLQPVHAPGVGENQNVGVGGGDEQMLDKILVARLHPGAAGPPAALHAVGGDRRPLQIAGVGDRHRNLLVGDEVFQFDLSGFVLNDRAALVTVLLPDFFQFFDDHAAQLFLGG